MISKKPSSFLDEMILLLAREFGVERVRRALDRIPMDSGQATGGRQSPSTKPRPIASPSILETLEELGKTDEGKHRLLVDFYKDLKGQKLLPESQDIRQFAQVIGLKEIDGKSRRDLIPKLMRFLVGQPTERLRVDLLKAAGISEGERQQGFSVLTDKLLNENKRPESS